MGPPEASGRRNRRATSLAEVWSPASNLAKHFKNGERRFCRSKPKRHSRVFHCTVRDQIYTRGSNDTASRANLPVATVPSNRPLPASREISSVPSSYTNNVETDKTKALLCPWASRQTAAYLDLRAMLTPAYLPCNSLWLLTC